MRKLTLLTISLLLLSSSLFAQDIGGFFGPARTIRHGTSDPSTCAPTGNNVFYNRTSGILKLCTATNVWSTGNQSLGTGSMTVSGTTAAPTALTTALVVTAGNIDAGSHSYKVTFVTAGGETDGGTTSNTVVNDVTHAQNTPTSVPLGNQFVTSRKIYRNTVAAPTVYKLQQTIANNTATSGVQDNTADSGLTTAIPTTNTAIDNRLAISNAGLLTLGPVGEIVGTTTNNNASTGSIGEYITGTVAAATTSLTSPNAINVGANTNISLTAGDWDCHGVVNFTPTGTTSITQLRGGVSTTTGTLPSQDSYFGYATAANVPTAIVLSWVSPTVRLSISGTTNVFLVAQATFSASTLTAGGTIRCRRAR